MLFGSFIRGSYALWVFYPRVLCSLSDLPWMLTSVERDAFWISSEIYASIASDICAADLLVIHRQITLSTTSSTSIRTHPLPNNNKNKNSYSQTESSYEFSTTMRRPAIATVAEQSTLKADQDIMLENTWKMYVRQYCQHYHGSTLRVFSC